MAHVAARATQLIAIFYRDPGLLVELKRWVAKDAADNGQLVSDTDLTDEAIFNRLETDVIFRSQATLLVQKYGYLLPELNPESLYRSSKRCLCKSASEGRRRVSNVLG